GAVALTFSGSSPLILSRKRSPAWQDQPSTENRLRSMARATSSARHLARFPAMIQSSSRRRPFTLAHRPFTSALPYMRRVNRLQRYPISTVYFVTKTVYFVTPSVGEIPNIFCRGPASTFVVPETMFLASYPGFFATAKARFVAKKIGGD